MKSRKYISQAPLTFHKWKRKGYAVFASLGKLIKIGRLSVAISQEVTSQNDIKAALIHCLNTGSDKDDKNENDGIPDPDQLLLLISGFSFISCTSAKLDIHPKELVPLFGLIYYILFLIKVHFLPGAENGFFYFKNL